MASRDSPTSTAVLVAVSAALAAVAVSLKYTKTESETKEVRVDAPTRHMACESTKQALARCLYSWRHEGLGMYPMPVVTNPGQAETGLGLRLTRGNLREGIIDYKHDKNTDIHTLKYTVLNPGWTVWPVYTYIGKIRLVPINAGHSDKQTTTNFVLLEWSSTYKPLSLGPIVDPFFHFILRGFVKFLVTWGSAHVANPKLAHLDGSKDE